MFIVKPNASSRGRGIRVISHKHEIPRARKCMIQSYLPNPFLVDGYKSDMRCAHDISIKCMLNICHACFYMDSLVPVARITAPLQIGECEGLSISGANSYGGGTPMHSTRISKRLSIPLCNALRVAHVARW